MSRNNIYLIVIVGLSIVLFFIFFLPSDFNSPKPEKTVVQEASDVFDACIKDPDKASLGKENCYAAELERVAKENGPNYAFETLFALQGIDPNAIGCHFIAHGIGYGSYDRSPEKWQEYINTFNQACSYGGIHGVIEKYVSSLPGGELTDEIIPRLCGSNPRADCNHIVGHLVLVETKTNIDEALKLCDLLSGQIQKDFCFTGVFMEYQTAVNLIKHGLAPESWLNWPARVDELEEVCRSYGKSKYAEACWEEIVHAALVKFSDDPKEIFSFCDSAPLVDASIKCRRHSIGIMAASINFDLEKLKPACKIEQVGNSSFEGDCYVQLAASAMSTNQNLAPKVESFCLSLNSEFKDSCLTQVNASKRSIQQD